VSKWPIFPNGRFFLVDHYTVDLFFHQWTFFRGRFFPWTLFPKFGTTFSPVHRPWEPQCIEIQTDKRTDAETSDDDANSRSYYVAVRSAKMEIYRQCFTASFVGRKCWLLTTMWLFYQRSVHARVRQLCLQVVMTAPVMRLTTVPSHTSLEVSPFLLNAWPFERY